jgi:hypothetical protein
MTRAVNKSISCLLTPMRDQTQPKDPVTDSPAPVMLAPFEIGLFFTLSI